MRRRPLSARPSTPAPRSTPALLVLALGAVPLVAGCGDDDGADAGTAPTATVTATVTASAEVTEEAVVEPPPVPEGPTGQDAVDFFRSTEADCAAFATSVGNDVLPGFLFTDASVGRDLGDGSWVVVDGAGAELVVDLSAGVVHGVDGPTGVLPIDYSFGCPETLYLGSAGD